jgi:hypothetical protein
MAATDFQKRAALFLIGCMGTRFGITYIAKTKLELLPTLGLLAVGPAIGFLVIYFFGLRKTGLETMGAPIWWNDLRVMHGVLYGIFAYLALQSNKNAWIVLLIDTIIGLLAWTNHHFL